MCQALTVPPRGATQQPVTSFSRGMGGSEGSPLAELAPEGPGYNLNAPCPDASQVSESRQDGPGWGPRPHTHLVPDLPMHQVFLHLESLERGLLHGALEQTTARSAGATLRGLGVTGPGPAALPGGPPPRCDHITLSFQSLAALGGAPSGEGDVLLEISVTRKAPAQRPLCPCLPDGLH